MLKSKVQVPLAHFSKLIMSMVNQQALASNMTNMAAILVAMMITAKFAAMLVAMVILTNIAAILVAMVIMTIIVVGAVFRDYD